MLVDDQPAALLKEWPAHELTGFVVLAEKGSGTQECLMFDLGRPLLRLCGEVSVDLPPFCVLCLLAAAECPGDLIRDHRGLRRFLPGRPPAHLLAEGHSPAAAVELPVALLGRGLLDE